MKKAKNIIWICNFMLVIYCVFLLAKPGPDKKIKSSPTLLAVAKVEYSQKETGLSSEALKKISKKAYSGLQSGEVNAELIILFQQAQFFISKHVSKQKNTQCIIMLFDQGGNVAGSYSRKLKGYSLYKMKIKSSKKLWCTILHETHHACSINRDAEKKSLYWFNEEYQAEMLSLKLCVETMGEKIPESLRGYPGDDHAIKAIDNMYDGYMLEVVKLGSKLLLDEEAYYTASGDFHDGLPYTLAEYTYRFLKSKGVRASLDCDENMDLIERMKNK